MPALLAAVPAAGVTGTVLTAPAVAQSEVISTTISALAAAVVGYGKALNLQVVREINRTAIRGSDVHGTSGEALRGSDIFLAAKWQHIAEQASKAAKDAADRDLGDR